jgi:hypothetical protein
MRSRTSRALSTIVTVALAAGALAVLAPSAHASTSRKSFCAIVTDVDESNFTGADPDSADFAVNQIKKLLKAKAPKKVKKALKVIKKYYEQVADGDVDPTGAPSAKAAKAFATYGMYVANHCQ